MISEEVDLKNPREGRSIDYPDLMSELLRIWDLETQSGVVLIRADDFHKAIPVIVRGLAAHAVDCARAIVLLYEKGVEAAAIPIIRALVEDVITMEWMLKSPDSWKVVRNKSAKQQLGSLEDYLSRMPSDVFLDARREDLRASLEERQLPVGWTVEGRAKVDASGATPSYELYRIASDLTHAGMGVVEMYTEVDPYSPLGVRFLSKAELPDARAWFSVATSMLSRAILAWNEMLSNDPFGPRVQAISAEMAGAAAASSGSDHLSQSE
jgi:hypothetical protein